MRPLLLLFAAAALVAHAEDFCSLTVSVTTNDELKPSGVYVEVQEENGLRHVERTAEGVARFCGLGISSVTVTVGSNRPSCQTVVHNVPLEWPVPYTLTAVYDHRPCAIAELDHVVAARPDGVYHCSTLLRFVDQYKNPVPDVTVTLALRSDPYGRLMMPFRSNGDLHPIAQKDGFVSETIDLKCPYEGSVEERIIVLKKAP
jgi:hypothetical protein